MNFNKNLSWLLFLLVVPFLAKSQSTKSYPYDTVPGDPLHARIYMLENGLKVFISVNKNEPRFQSMIGVKAGSKNDPANHTGLAHYLEHMLFKGTDVFGTQDYKKEAPLIDTIFSLYEQYGTCKDSLMRIKIYRQIDSVSGIAATYAIPNEFDKMMTALGAKNVNAYTSNEQTVYINDVPSNQLVNFIALEAERFRKPVMRLFHTELEAVYEEKNRSLDNDGSKVYENIMSGLFEKHPYGTQTTIGTIEHLKSPSLKAIQEYFDKYYVPNNMVISLSGDLDPDLAIRLIDEHFGKMPAKEIPAFIVPQEKFIKIPVVREVWGPDAESVSIGFRFKGASSEDADVLTMVDYILSNGQAGLLDINLNNKQKVLNAYSSTNILKDYSVHILKGRPREGQTLEQVRDLLMEQIMELKLGNFPDWIIAAIVTNMRLELQAGFENNMTRASVMLNSEIEGVPYKQVVQRIDRLSRINKQQIIDFVRTWYGDNHVVVFKRTGVDENIVKVVKPAITPVATNSEKQSDFVKRILATKVNDIQPVFIDFEKDITIGKLKGGIPVFMTLNDENDLFNLNYSFDMGFANDRRWPVIAQYVNYLGTAQLNASQVQEEFYKLGCSFTMSVEEDEIKIQLSGLKDHFISALTLMESLLSGAKADEKVLQNLLNDIIRARENAKLNKGQILAKLTSYAKYGAVSPATYALSNEELKALKGQDLLVLLRNLNGYVHKVNYYGPLDSTSIMSALAKFHKLPRGLQAAPAQKVFQEEDTEDAKVFYVNYDMKQAEVNFISRGGAYNKDAQPYVILYNYYFSGDMSAPVFQELRESKALAYGVYSNYNPPLRKDRPYYNTAYIGTQADKLPEALAGMMDLLQNLPLSEQNFTKAKESVLQTIRADRISRKNLLTYYHAQRKLGNNYDIRQDVFRKVQELSLRDIASFHQQQLKGKKYRLAIIGNKELINFKDLGKYGPLNELQVEQVFGY